MDDKLEYLIQLLSHKVTRAKLKTTEADTNLVKCRALIVNLSCDDKAKEILEEAVQMIVSRSDAYARAYCYMMSIWSDITISSPMFIAIEHQIKADTAPSTIVSLPEKLLQPLLSDLHSVVKEGCVDMHRSAIHRHLGDLYHCLYVHYRHGEGETRQAMEECHHKVVHYYTEGLEMVYPDGWSDRRLGGYVRLATFYHLSGQTDRVEETLQHLEPLLEWGKGEYANTKLTPIAIDTEEKYHVLPWKQDRLLHTHLIEPCNRGDILYIHLACLGYYIQVRWLLGVRCDPDEGGDDITSVVPVVPSITVIVKVTMTLAHMEEMVKYIDETDILFSSQTLINIIKI